MGSNGQPKSEELITLTIDDREVSVPKGTNLIEAARLAGTEVPYYCYHPHLSVPGNCRMCQVEVEGAPKLMIGCHTTVQPNMVVRTHKTSKQVEDAQASTLELILINHPLDCTVCDQAGHCKLQDYHFEYNARPSRFLENKQKKVKAKSLGPTVMLDGERCIACTRCIRFCDEITGTSEIGLVNRGDRVEIAVHEDHELENPLSGTVVDLCPVGALTHKQWRFNTRIWYSKAVDTVCPGCSTGCNVKAFERDGQVVQVKARLNADVNKEWMCDEGRYGFGRFLPEDRLLAPRLGEKELTWDEALKAASKLKSGKTAVFLSPDLLLEEYSLAKEFIAECLGESTVALQIRHRELSDVEAVLISPDYAPNFEGAIFSGLFGDGSLLEAGDLERGYLELLDALRSGNFENVLLIGDRALDPAAAQDEQLQQVIQATGLTVALCTDASLPVVSSALCLPARSILEKQGLLVNRSGRLQFSDRVVQFPDGTEPHWRLLRRIADAAGKKLTAASSDRDLTLELLAADERLGGLTIRAIKDGGVCLKTYRPQAEVSSDRSGERPSA